MKQEMQRRGSGKVREFALYGEYGETNKFILPVRHDWAKEYRGRATVVCGHAPVPELEWLNCTVSIDTGCVFGGKLAALRYLEREFVSVPAAQTYAEPVRPFLPTEQQAFALSAQQAHDEVFDVDGALDKPIIPTRLWGNVTIREENADALEVMNRFAVDPSWSILPRRFAYYRGEGVPQVVCEEKHMGSRAVVVACKDKAAARERFDITSGELGIVTTRTGRRFFNRRPGTPVPGPHARGPWLRRCLEEA